MKQILSMILVLAVLGGAAFLNPTEERHQDAIVAQYKDENPISGRLGIGHVFAEATTYHNYGLFLLILIFSLCFPLVKIFALAYVWYSEFASERRKTLLRNIEALGRWSMLDVFVVALLVVTIKLGLFADVEVHVGIYIFATSVLASMTASLLIQRLEA